MIFIHPDTGPGNRILIAGMMRMSMESVDHPTTDIMSLEMDAMKNASPVNIMEPNNNVRIMSEMF